MKTKADTPVPRCIASQQLQSRSWWFRKAHGHLALVALQGKGKEGVGPTNHAIYVSCFLQMPLFLRRPGQHLISLCRCVRFMSA